MSKAICDHHMTNSWSTIWPIHHLTIIWPTHFRSMHMTNDMANISISTNLIICGGSNIKCKWFILRVIYLYGPSPVKPPNNNSQPHYPFKMDFGPPSWLPEHKSIPPPTYEHFPKSFMLLMSPPLASSVVIYSWILRALSPTVPHPPRCVAESVSPPLSWWEKSLLPFLSVHDSPRIVKSPCCMPRPLSHHHPYVLMSLLALVSGGVI